MRLRQTLRFDEDLSVHGSWKGLGTGKTFGAEFYSLSSSRVCTGSVLRGSSVRTRGFLGKGVGMELPPSRMSGSSNCICLRLIVGVMEEVGFEDTATLPRSAWRS